MKKRSRPIQFNLRLSSEEYAKIRQEAYERNIPMNVLIRQSIATYMGLYTKQAISDNKEVYNG